MVGKHRNQTVHSVNFNDLKQALSVIPKRNGKRLERRSVSTAEGVTLTCSRMSTPEATKEQG